MGTLTLVLDALVCNFNYHLHWKIFQPFQSIAVYMGCNKSFHSADIDAQSLEQHVVFQNQLDKLNLWIYIVQVLEGKNSDSIVSSTIYSICAFLYFMLSPISNSSAQLKRTFAVLDNAGLF